MFCSAFYKGRGHGDKKTARTCSEPWVVIHLEQIHTCTWWGDSSEKWLFVLFDWLIQHLCADTVLSPLCCCHTDLLSPVESTLRCIDAVFKLLHVQTFLVCAWTPRVYLQDTLCVTLCCAWDTSSARQKWGNIENIVNIVFDLPLKSFTTFGINVAHIWSCGLLTRLDCPLLRFFTVLYYFTTVY